MKRIMTQIIAVLAVMIAVPAMVGGNSIASATTTISLDDLTCDPGGTVTAEVMLKDIQNYGTGTMNITYNPYVVHVTGVTGNTNSTYITHNEDNTAGVVTISAWNTGGVSGDIEFISITFKAVGTDSTPLGLDVTKLRDTSMTTPIPFETVDGSITVGGGNGGTEPQLPFVIDGCVSNSNGDPCNDPVINITNPDTGAEWQADTIASSNYYQIALTSGSDLNATDVLRFNATDGTNTSIIDHAITDDDVTNGGLFGFNITLASPDLAPSLVIYTISNTTISPDGDGIMDDTEIDVEFSESVSAAIKIENASGVIKTLYTSSSVKNPNPKIWDGTDDGGNIVADGTYHVNVTMDDGVNHIVYDNTRSIMVANISVATISIGNVSGNVTVPIIIEDGTNVGACDINIIYNASVCMIADVTNGTFDWTFANLEHNETGCVRIGALQTDNIGLNGSIILANITFRSNSTNGTSPLNLSVTTLKDATPQCNKISYIVQNGTYIAALNGDVNGDGVVDIADAMYLAKHVLGKSGFEEIIVGAADVNDDGVIDIADAMYLAKHILGKSGFEELR